MSDPPKQRPVIRRRIEKIANQNRVQPSQSVQFQQEYVQMQKEQKKGSQIMREQIAEGEQAIKDRQAEIGRLMSEQRKRPTPRGGDNRVAVLQRAIVSTQERINELKRKLSMQEKIEEAHDRMVAQMAEKERQQAAADRAAHDQAVRAAALQEWLRVPGQTEATFNQAWPSIAHQIAVNQAVEAGAAESQADHAAPMRQAVADALAARYGKGAKA